MAENVFQTKDQNLILSMFALGHNPIGCERGMTGMTTFMFDKSEVASTLQKWFSNEPIPLDDIRRYIIAKELFASYLRGDSPGEFFPRRDKEWVRPEL